MFIENICDTDKCVGCGNCKVVCPVNAVTMVPNSEGFLYPSVDHSICIQCGKCEAHCPHMGLKYKEVRDLPEALIVKAKNTDLLKTSASGGLCTILAHHFIGKLKGYVCGAVYDEAFMVHHIVSNNPDDVDRMRQSKYVQSDLEECFPDIKVKLEADNNVLMIGTGCQIYALKKFLGKEYEKLFCIDLICHGVPSSKVQEEYIRWLEQRNGKVLSVNNRNKKLYSHSYTSTYAVTFDNGKTIVKRYSDDPMADAFFQHLSIRKSCFDCQFKTIHRISDLTIGDFWFSEIYGFGEDTLGVNLCLMQSEKGKAMLNDILEGVIVKTVDTKTAVVLNGGMIYSSCKENRNRKRFFEKLGKEPFDKLVFSLDGINAKVKMKNHMREIFAPVLRKTKYYNKQLAKGADKRKKRNIPEEKTGLNCY